MDIRNKVLSILVRDLDLYNLRGNETFDELGADSLDRHEIGMSFEEEFDIYIDDREIRSLQDIPALVDLITEKVGQRSSK